MPFHALHHQDDHITVHKASKSNAHRHTKNTPTHVHKHTDTRLEGWKKGDIKLCLVTMTMLCKPPEHCFVLMTCHRKLCSTERTHKSLRHSWALVYYRQRNNKETQKTVTTLLTPLLYIRQNRTLISHTIQFLFCTKTFTYRNFNLKNKQTSYWKKLHR